MIAQEERLSKFRILETRSTSRERNLPPEYLRTLHQLNDEAVVAGQNAFLAPAWSVNVNPELATLARAIPPDILEAMKNNVNRCWERLKHFISQDQYTPDERIIAHSRARKCVCDELQELLNYLGSLPDDLQAYWNACGCPITKTAITDQISDAPRA
jgi:hypothetical protein